MHGLAGDISFFFAHGVVKRASLPIPEWLFGWAAAIVLIVSFLALAVLWPKPRLEKVEWKPIPGGAFFGSKAVETVCQVIGVVLFVLVVLAGYLGPESSDNFATVFVFIIFWVGLVFLSVLLGDVFKAFNPWRAMGRVIDRVRGKEGSRPYPERLGRWPAAAGILAFAWVELVSDYPGKPATLATLILIYTAITLAMQWRYGTEAWTARGETFSVYFNLFSRLAVLENRDHVVGRRPFLGGLPTLDLVAGTVGVVVVMIGTVTFDGLSAGNLWTQDVSVGLQDFFTSLGGPATDAVRFANTVGLLLAVGLVAAFYHLGILGAKSVGGGFDADRLRRGFAHSLVPIAMVYAAAHYLTLLVFEGQQIAFLISDPLDRGWDLFGTASAGIDFGVLSQNATWYLQVGFVVLGHVAALVLAHDRALVLYGQAKQAVRSQYWMLGIMVGFTTLALWLLAQANA